MNTNKIKQFLRTKVYESKYVYIDYWSFVHLLAGFKMWYWFKLPWLTALTILIIYEMWENLIPQKLFKKESKKDMIGDIVIAMIGYYIATII